MSTDQAITIPNFQSITSNDKDELGDKPLTMGSSLENLQDNKEPTVATKECRFVQYVPPSDRGEPDLHVVKEILHMSDNTVRTNILQVENYKRPFYLTKTGCRNHEDKKEWEHLNRLNKYMGRECDMPDYITRLLNTSSAKGNKRKANTSPYVYGSDITSTALIKQTYLNKYKEKKTPLVS